MRRMWCPLVSDEDYVTVVGYWFSHRFLGYVFSVVIGKEWPWMKVHIYRHRGRPRRKVRE